jgi:hypothetical protein
MQERLKSGVLCEIPGLMPEDDMAVNVSASQVEDAIRKGAAIAVKESVQYLAGNSWRARRMSRERERRLVNVCDVMRKPEITKKTSTPRNPVGIGIVQE